MKKLFSLCVLLFYVILLKAQYNPSNFTVTNKAMGIAQAVPTDARSFYYDASLFIMRPYQSTAEACSYLNFTKYRTGNFPVYINTGTLQSGGTFTGGTIVEYWFKDGTANSNLVIKQASESDPKRVTGVAITGTSTKTITLTLADASTVTNTFTDLNGDSTVFSTIYQTDTAKANLRAATALKEAAANKGVANGYAPLNGATKIDPAYLPAGSTTYKGTWNASTNTPTLSDATGTAGWTYTVSVAGTQNLGSGAIAWAAGDQAIHNGTIYQRSPNGSAVVDVNGKTGSVVIDKTDVGLGNNDNTSDANKPISTATAMALATKANQSALVDTAARLQADKVDKVTGKQLSTEDYTTAEKTKLAGLSGTVERVSVVSANGVSGTVSDSTTTAAITLSLGAITPTSVAATGTVTGSNLSGANTGDQDLSGKVDKVTGKQLSTEDYTTTEKTKLAAITGTNTGDETASTIKTKLGITTLSGSNTGDQDLSPYKTITAHNIDTTSLGSASRALVNATNTAVALKAPLASPTFTGVATFPTPFTLGATSVTTTGTQLNYLNTTTSDVQTQINTKWGLSGSAATPGLLNNGSYLGTSNNVSLRIRTNNAERMVVDSSTGNVGIGGQPSGSSKLFVTGAISTNSSYTTLISPNDATEYEAIGLKKINGGTGSIPNTGLAITFQYRNPNGLIPVDRFVDRIYDTTSATFLTGYEFYNHNSSPLTSTLSMFIKGNKVGIGQTTAGIAGTSILDIASTTLGVLLPRMTKTQRNAIASPAAGLQVMVTGESGGEYLSWYNSTLAAWVKVSSVAD